MQPRRERATPKSERNWWRFLPVLGAVGLIGLMLVLTFMPSSLDETNPNPSEVALLGSVTPSIHSSATIITAPFPTTILEQPPIQVVAATPQANSEPVLVDDATQPILNPDSSVYALLHSEDAEFDRLVRIVDGRVLPIAAVDSGSVNSTILLQAEQTLIIKRDQTLLGLATTTGELRWSFEIPADSFDPLVALDVTATGIYVLHEYGDESWQLHHLRLADAQVLTPMVEFQLSVVSVPDLLTKTGQVWFINNQELYRIDLKTNSYQNFGRALHNVLVGDSQSDAIGLFRSPTQLTLIDLQTEVERSVDLSQPVDDSIEVGLFSNDQQALLIQSYHSPTFLLYSIQDGKVKARLEYGYNSRAVPSTHADQWLITRINQPEPQLLRWNSATNTLTDVVIPAEIVGYTIVWMRELSGEPIVPVANDLEIILTPSPMLEAPMTNSIALVGNLTASSINIQRIDLNQQTLPVAADVVRVFPRYNQAPLLLQHPQPERWQLFDPITQQRAYWKFPKPLQADEFVPIYHPNQASMLAVVHQRVSSSNKFTGFSQLIEFNSLTGDWQILFDSDLWPELEYAQPIAWKVGAIYFLQTTNIQYIIWEVEWYPGFGFGGVTKIAEVPINLAVYPEASSPIVAKILVSPNQHWLLYPLRLTDQGVLMQVLDLNDQRNHQFALPLEALSRLSFSPFNNSFAVMLPDTENGGHYPGLYQLEQQQWYRLDPSSYEYYTQSPFLWSPDGRWLAVGFGHISDQQRISIYDAFESKLVLNSLIDPDLRPIALYDDSNTLLMRHWQQPQLTQMTWHDQEWQINWQLQGIDLDTDNIQYLYPR
ncbi:hypothetical protein [Herpetosiphon gulosus]|uniref:Uncharacterized protein n=1 Tax=Herpetosiphon gulosus TaxID=1973496 RepID=A0ABP9X6S4_9CHLR